MYFQIIDSNEKCKKSYTDRGLVDYSAENPENKTWKHTPHLASRSDIDYAYIYCNGSFDVACPGFLQDSWKESYNKMTAVMKTVHHSECDLDNSCIYDYIPDWILHNFLSNKQKLIKSVFEGMPKPDHYDILRKSHILCEEMNSEYRIFKNRVGKTNYNIFGTKTGRLSNAKASIPILTMKKEERKYLKPNNDLFVEFDFNAAELRTLLALSGKQQPEGDIHSWTSSQVGIDREEMKKRTFAWLYNPEASDSLLERFYDRIGVKHRYYDGNAVETPFFRKINTDDRRALNYIIQSTSSDVCIEQSFKLREFFKNCRTKICYLLHDSVILDFAKEDREKFTEAKRIFANTRFGNYRVNASIGKNFGEMRVV